MKKQYVAGIDVGTTGAKAMLFDFEGNVAASGYVEYSCMYPKPNWVEQDAKVLIESVYACCGAMIKNGGIDPAEIVAVSVSAQRSSCVFVDQNDEPVKMISWMDNRAAEQVTQIANTLGAQEFYRISGLPLNTCWILPKIMWVREHAPEIWEKTHIVCQVQDYILKYLGADGYYSDEPEAAFWGFWDTDNHVFHQGMMERFDIPAAKVPEVLCAGTRVGAISEYAAQKSGLKKGTTLCVGIGDQNSAAIGAGVVEEGLFSASLGTGGLATVLLKSRYRDQTGNTMITNHALHGLWEFEGLQNAAAVVYKWFANEIAGLESFRANEAGGNVYEALNQLVSKAPPGAKGLVMMPYFASAAAPRWNPDARGAFLGLTLAHDRACLARACMEGITMEMRDILEGIQKNGFRLQKGRIIGGATRSEEWNQIQADIYNLPVETLRVTDSAVLGAAMCAAQGVGIFRDVKEAAEVMVRPAKRYEPIRENAVLYDEIYDIYCSAYESMKHGGVYEKLAKLQTKY